MLYKFLKPILSFFLNFLFKIDVIGDIEIKDDSYIICSNHLSNFDPLILAIIWPESINFMGKMELFKNSISKWFLDKVHVFPVNRKGNDIKALKIATKRLKDNNIVGILPEGTRVKSFDIDNSHPGPIVISKMSGKDIIPVYIDTDYRLFSQVNVYIKKPFKINEKLIKEDKTNGYEIEAKRLLNTIYKG